MAETLPQTTDAERLIRHVFGISRGYFVIARARHEHGTKTQVPKSFHDVYYSYPNEVPRAVRDAFRWDAEGQDVYVSTHLLKERGSRKKVNAATVRALFSDIDNGSPPAELPPSALIESSPGRLQGYWQLREATPPEAAEQLNQRLAVACGADPSGADISQVLRLPGTHNWTRLGAPIVRLLELHGSVTYSRDQLDQALPRGAARQSTAAPKAAGAKVPSGKRHPYVMGILASAARFGVSGEALERIANALNECELEQALPPDELAGIVEHVTGFAPDEQYLSLRDAERCEHCEAKEAWAAKQQARAEAAEQKAHRSKLLLDDIAEVVASPKFGEEVRLLIGLAIAHDRGDPALEPMPGTTNRWRLTQKLARRLCGKANLKTAGSYALKLAEGGLLPLGPEDYRPFTKTDGHKADAYTLTYQWPPPEAEHAATTAEATQTTLISRSRRLKAERERREARGDVRRFNGCPDHPHARVKMRRHCSVCDRCLEPRGDNAHATVPVVRPDREPLQTLEPRSRGSIQTLERRPCCRACGDALPALGAPCRRCAVPPAELLADLAAVSAKAPEPLQSLERKPVQLRGAKLTAFLVQREALQSTAAGGGA